MLKILQRSWWGRKIARCIFRRRYFLFFWKENTEWDWSSIVDMLDLKFTIMGTTIWKWGVATSNRNVAHRCWVLRKYLRDIAKGEDKGREESGMAFKEMYGFFPEFEFKFENHILQMPLIIPEGFDKSRREEMEQAYQKMNVLEWGERNILAAIRGFCLEFEKSIRYLWD